MCALAHWSGATACDALDRALGTFAVEQASITADWSLVAARLKAHNHG